MSKELHHYVDGRHVAGTGGRFGDVYNPATGKVRTITRKVITPAKNG